MQQLDEGFFSRDPLVCARELVGASFRWGACAGRVVETEAYAEHGDEACHTYHRPTAREFVAGEPAGTAYVYLNYGMYWLMNVLCKCPKSDKNGFVLLRALEPTEGIAKMQERRSREKLTELCSGPGKLSMALGIGREDHGRSLVASAQHGFFRPLETGLPAIDVLDDIRVGISAAQELPWRFLERDCPHVSVKYGKVKKS